MSPEQRQRMVQLLQVDETFRRDYVRLCQLSSQLMWAAQGAPPDLNLRDRGIAIPAKNAVTRVSRRKRLSPQRVSLGAIVVLVALGLAWTFRPNRESAPLGVVSSVTGTVAVVRGNQPAMPLRADDVLKAPLPMRPGDQIQTDAVGSAVLVLADRTRILLGPESQMTLAARPDARVVVSSGHVTAQVAPQRADAPMIFVTPRASVRVLGTELELMVSKERTEIAVTEGKVRVTRSADGTSAEVSAGQFLPVDEDESLAVIDWPTPPESWSEDFESGLPPGWTGQFVREALPAGSRGALQGRAIPEAPGLRMVAGSPLIERGLFAWHDDSMLHVTFRVQPPAWFHVCLLARTYSRREPLIAWCRVDPDLWRVRAGEWRTVEIPLSEFRWTGSTQPEATLGRIPLQLTFVGPGDLPGVVIDSVRVERKGFEASRLSDPSAGGDPR